MYIEYLCVIILKSPIALIFMALFACTKMCSYIYISFLKMIIEFMIPAYILQYIFYYLLNKLLEMKEMYSSFNQMKTLYTHSLLEAMQKQQPCMNGKYLFQFNGILRTNETTSNHKEGRDIIQTKLTHIVYVALVYIMSLP